MTTTFARVFTDMELDRKFKVTTACRSVKFGSLHPDRQYPIVHAEQANSRYGHSVLLAILDSPTTPVSVST